MVMKKSTNGSPPTIEDLMCFVAQMTLIPPLNGCLKMVVILAFQILTFELLTSIMVGGKRMVS